MKQGRSINELAAELERQRVSKRDFVADTRKIAPVVIDNQINLTLESLGTYKVQNHCHQQLCTATGIPKKYYDRMVAEAPSLLVTNLNHWFTNQPAKHLIRTLDGNARAFLSDRYRVLDNFDLAESILPILADQAGGIKIVSSEITDNRLYIKAVNENFTKEVKVGDPVRAGIVISNSEIGLGSVRIEPLIERLVCTNGMIAADHAMRKYHVGRKGDQTDSAWEVFRDETKQLSDKAFWNKVKDLTNAALRQAGFFEKLVEQLQQATEKEINSKEPEKVVEIVAKDYNLQESESTGILRYLLSGNDLTQYGLVNAVTRYSQDVQNYDRATELERTGGKILELSGSDWSRLNKV